MENDQNLTSLTPDKRETRERKRFMQYNFYVGLGSIYIYIYIYIFLDLLLITVYDHQVMNKAIIIGQFILLLLHHQTNIASMYQSNAAMCK